MKKSIKITAIIIAVLFFALLTFFTPFHYFGVEARDAWSKKVVDARFDERPSFISIIDGGSIIIAQANYSASLTVIDKNGSSRRLVDNRDGEEPHMESVSEAKLIRFTKLKDARKYEKQYEASYYKGAKRFGKTVITGGKKAVRALTRFSWYALGK